MTDSLGRSLRDDYEVRGLEPPESEIPDVASHIWEWFWRLSSCRSSGMNSPNPISFLEIDSFSRITGNIIRPEEVEAICTMDSAYLEALNKRRKEIDDKNREFQELSKKSKAKTRGKR